MKISNILLMIVLGFSLYKGYLHFKGKGSLDTVKAEKGINQNPRNKNAGVLNVKDKDSLVMKDKRINPIAGESIGTDVSKINNDPIRQRVPNNLERILQYEMNVWSRGLDPDEISSLKHIWAQYSSGKKFTSKEKDMLDTLDKRNILNAIRVSKPSIIKSKDDLKNIEDKQIDNERDQSNSSNDNDDYSGRQDSYNNDSYNQDPEPTDDPIESIIDNHNQEQDSKEYREESIPNQDNETPSEPTNQDGYNDAEYRENGTGYEPESSNENNY